MDSNVSAKADWSGVPYQGMDLFVNNSIIITTWVGAGVTLRRDPLFAPPRLCAGAMELEDGCRIQIVDSRQSSPPHTLRGTILFTFGFHHPGLG